MKKYLFAAALAAVALTSASTARSADPVVPEGAMKVGTDPKSGRPIYMLRNQDDPVIVSAITGSIKSYEFLYWECVAAIRDQRSSLERNGLIDEFEKGPPHPPRKEEVERGHRVAHPGQRRDDNDSVQAIMMMNAEADNGPIILGGSVIPALEKEKLRWKKKWIECTHRHLYALWLIIPPPRDPFKGATLPPELWGVE
jgi:hypothetical protein